MVLSSIDILVIISLINFNGLYMNCSKHFLNELVAKILIDVSIICKGIAYQNFNWCKYYFSRKCLLTLELMQVLFFKEMLTETWIDASIICQGNAY